MSYRYKITIKGLDKLQRDLLKMGREKELKDTLKDFAIRANLDLRAQTIESFVKGYSTGRTRETTDYDIEGNAITVGATTYYSPFVEEGTYKMEAEPFVGPMAERQAKELKRRLERLVE